MSSKADKEISAMDTAHAAISGLKPDEQSRVLAWLAQKLGVAPVAMTPRTPTINPPGSPASVGTGSTSNPILNQNPRTFMTQKRPSDFQERVACLAYCLTHFKNTPMFKTQDITKMNSEAGQSNLYNSTAFVNNSLRCQYLSSAGGGRKQITPRGEAVVNALPNREAVTQALIDYPLAGGRKKKGKKKKKTKTS
jgi:hypothetical protein